MTFDPLVYYGILLLSIAVTLLTTVVFGTFKPRLALAYLGSALLVGGGAGAAAMRGTFKNFDAVPPPFALAAVVFFIGPILLGRSGVGKAAADNVPVQLLVLIQAFRLPLELVMHYAYTAGIMPKELSFEGFNYDILTGASALILGFTMLIRRRIYPRLILLWNLWGSICLAVIAFVAISSSPMFMLFGEAPHQVNTWVLRFPYILLPALLVTNAIFTHVVIFRILGNHETRRHSN